MKKIILFVIFSCLLLTGCNEQNERQNEKKIVEETCCECKDCPACDVCCSCEHPYLSK